MKHYVAEVYYICMRPFYTTTSVIHVLFWFTRFAHCFFVYLSDHIFKRKYYFSHQKSKILGLLIAVAILTVKIASSITVCYKLYLGSALQKNSSLRWSTAFLMCRFVIWLKSKKTFLRQQRHLRRPVELEKKN